MAIKAAGSLRRVGRVARLHGERRTHARCASQVAAPCIEQNRRGGARSGARRRGCSVKCNARRRTARCTCAAERACGEQRAERHVAGDSRLGKRGRGFARAVYSRARSSRARRAGDRHPADRASRATHRGAGLGQFGRYGTAQAVDLRKRLEAAEQCATEAERRTETERERAERAEKRADEERARAVRAGGRVDEEWARADRERARADQAERRIKELEAEIQQARRRRSWWRWRR
jgi:hypothetical protein